MPLAGVKFVERVGEADIDLHFLWQNSIWPNQDTLDPSGDCYWDQDPFWNEDDSSDSSDEWAGLGWYRD